MQETARASWGILIAIVCARFAFGYQLQTVASLGPELIGRFGISFAQLGGLVGAYMLPGIVVALGCGFLAQRVGDRAVMAGGMALMTVGAAVAALAGGPGGIALARVVAGCGAVALTVMQGKVLADRFAGKLFLVTLGLMLGGFPVGIGVGQLTHAAIARAWGWRVAFLAGAVPVAIGVAVLLASWRGANRGAGRRLFWPSWAECELVVLAGLIWTFYNAAFSAFLTYVPSLLALRGTPVWVADVVMNLATWGNVPALLLSGPLAARFGAGRVFLFGSLVCMVAVAAMGLFGWPLLWGAMFGTLGAIQGGVIVGVGTLSARPQNRAVGMGLFYTTYYIGGTLFPALCGRAADLAGGPGGALLCGAGLSALALPCWYLHQSRARLPLPA